MARSLVLTLVGLWLGVLFSSWAIATATFRTAEAVAAAPPGSPAGVLAELVHDCHPLVSGWVQPAR